MGNEIFTINLSEEQLKKFIDYHATHTHTATIHEFNITLSLFNRICNKYNIHRHTRSESEILKRIALDEYCELLCNKSQEILNTYANLKSVEETCEAYNIKEYFLLYILSLNNLCPIYTRGALEDKF